MIDELIKHGAKLCNVRLFLEVFKFLTFKTVKVDDSLFKANSSNRLKSCL